MPELELRANEEARHGNREALERLEAELDYWRKDSATAWDTCEEYRVKLAKAVEALHEAIYMLDPDEEDIAKGAGLYRIVTTYKELTGGKDE